MSKLASNKGLTKVEDGITIGGRETWKLGGEIGLIL